MDDSKTYELTLIVNERADLFTFFKRMLRYFSDENIEINKMENEGVKRLAYRLNNEEMGRYIFYELTFYGDTNKFANLLNNDNDVLRYLLVSTKKEGSTM